MSDELNIVINGQALTAVQAMAVQVAITSFHAGMAEADALGGDEHGRRMTAAYRDRLSEVLGLMQMSDKPARELLPGEAEVDAWIDTLGQRADAMSDDKLPPLDKVIAEIERLRAEIERLWGPYRLAAQAMRSTI